MAGDQSVEITLSANSSAVEQAFAKMNRNLDIMADKLSEVQKRAKEGEKSLGKMADAAVKSYATSMKTSGADPSIPTGLTQSLAGLTASVGLLIKTQQEQAARQENSRAAQMSAGEAVRQVRINFQEDQTLKDRDLEKELQAVAQRTGARIGAVAVAASNAFSAGADTNRDALNAVEASLRVNPSDVASADTMAGRAIDLSAITGEKDMRANIGFMLNIQQASRVKRLEKLGATAVPAIAAVMARGDSPEQAGELFSAVNQLKKDEQGEQSGTMVKNLANRLAVFTTKTAGDDKDGRFRIPQAQIDALRAAGSTMERIEVMQRSPELRRQFIDKNPFEAGDQAFVEQILAADPRAVRALQDAQNKVNPLDARQVGLYEDKVRRVQGGAFEGATGSEERSQSNIEQFRLKSDIESRTATARKVLQDTLQETGIGWLERNVANQAFERAIVKGIAPEQAAGGILRSIRESGEQKFGPAPTDQQQEMLRLMQQQIELLRGLLKENERGNREVKDAVGNRPQVARPVPSAGLSR